MTPAAPDRGTLDGAPVTVAVVGAGGVGGFFAARAAARADVTVCVRTPFDRLVVHSPDGDLAPPVRITTDPASVGPVDWVLLATKAQQTAAARPWLDALVGPRTVVVVMQNGVRHTERVSPPVPSERVLPAVVYINAESSKPGVIIHRNYGYALVPAGDLADRLAGVLPGDLVRPRSDFATQAWTKLVVNSAVNSVTALTEQRIDVLQRDDVAATALQLMRECVAVARADGVPVDEGLPEFTLRRMRSQPEGAGTSMLYDRLAGRPLEHEALIGTVVRIGAERGVPTPVCSAFAALLAAVSDAAVSGAAVTPPIQ
ncbi:MAG: 2-dehydropantoate 2-reductase [Frankia sp.]